MAAQYTDTMRMMQETTTAAISITEVIIHLVGLFESKLRDHALFVDVICVFQYRPSPSRKQHKPQASSVRLRLRASYARELARVT